MKYEYFSNYAQALARMDVLHGAGYSAMLCDDGEYQVIRYTLKTMGGNAHLWNA